MTATKFYTLTDLLRPCHDGARIVPISKPTFYRLVAAGKFPKPRKLGKRSVWSDEDIALWREQFMESKDD